MGADQRLQYVRRYFPTSKRGAAIFASLIDEDERGLFLEQYYDAHSCLESVNPAEDQMLTTGILSYVLALRATKSTSEIEKLRRDVQNGTVILDEKDPRRIHLSGNTTEGLKKETTERMKEYRDIMDRLKATRDKRLEKIVNQQMTLVELLQKLADQKYQNSILDDIQSLNRMTTEELKRMLAGEKDGQGRTYPWLLGDFNAEEE
jgi:hypothetical protein